MRVALLALLLLVGCHRTQGVKGYVLDSADGAHVQVCDVDEDYVPSLPHGEPVAGARVRVEVKGKMGGWIPFGPYVEKSEVRTDGLGRFDLEWYEVPHPQDARLLVEKPGFVPLEYPFALPCLEELRVYLARDGAH